MNKYLKILKSKKDYLIREIKLFIQFNRNEEIYSKNLFQVKWIRKEKKL